MLRRLNDMRTATRALGLMTTMIITSLPVGMAAASPADPEEPTPTTIPDSTVAPDPSDPAPPPTTVAPEPTAPPETAPPSTVPPTTSPDTAAPPATSPPDTAAPPVTAAPPPPTTVAPTPFNELPPSTDKPSGDQATADAGAARTWANGCITHALRPGDRGAQVVCLQNRLRRLNFPVANNGRFGLRTADAVAQIKRRHRLDDDGIAGPAALNVIYNPRLKPTRMWGYCITRAVRPSDSGYQVRCLSRRLKSLNHPVGVDGRYTVRERESINWFKERIGGAKDGVAGAPTLDAIFNPKRKPIWVWGNCILDSLRPGDQGFQVKCLQSRLRRLNLLGNVDGYYGARTTAAVNVMRTRAGLAQDGIAGPKALKAIYTAQLPAPIRSGYDETGHQLSVVSVAGPWAPPLPSWSGSGRRIVYSRAHQRAWAVEWDGHIVRSWLVSGSLYGNEVPGSHHVYSKSRYACAYSGCGVILPYMVRYTPTPNGGNIGFHEIPFRDGQPIMSEYELGVPRSAGCTRQARLDAIFVWNWAPVGTTVYVV